MPRELASILRKKVKKITVVEPDKVATWVEAHPHWTDPADAARDFDADIVIFLEVEQFQIQSPGDLNMVHGESKVHIQVFEMEYPKNSKDKPIKDQPKEAHNIYDEYAETTFPNRGPLPIDSGNSRSAFKNTFLRIVVKEHLLALCRARSRRLDSRLANRATEYRGHGGVVADVDRHSPLTCPGTVDSGLTLLIIKPESIARLTRGSFQASRLLGCTHEMGVDCVVAGTDVRLAL